MVLGILGVALFWVPWIGFILALLAVIFGGVGINRAKRGEANNRGMAVAGLTCGIVGMAGWLLVLIAIASSLAT